MSQQEKRKSMFWVTLAMVLVVPFLALTHIIGVILKMAGETFLWGWFAIFLVARGTVSMFGKLKDKLL